MDKYEVSDEMVNKCKRSDLPEDKLFLTIQKISERLKKAEGMNKLYANHCHPSMFECFECLRNYYKKGVSICINYYFTKNFLELVTNLLECCFIEEVLSLKEFATSNDEVNRLILEVEKDYKYLIAIYNSFKVY